MKGMKKILVVFSLIHSLLVPSLLSAVEVASRLTDREIIERLTRMEEGLKGVENSLRAEIRAVEQSLRAEIRANAEAIKQLRADLNTQFDRLIRLMLGILAAFATMVTATIGFALWDRRTMIRPFETKVREIEEEISQNRQKLHALLETLRTLSQTDEQVSEVLRRFHLL